MPVVSKSPLNWWVLCVLLLIFSSSAMAANDNVLDLDLESLMQIQVTSAGRKEQNLMDVPAAIYVIDKEDINNSGATSIPELLRMVPGLQVARIGSSQWAITSRGFNGTFANKLLVQIDGRSVYTPSYSGVYWDVQNVVLEDVDRIEVIRGPGATLWGANAVNGIINIITKQASDTQGRLVSVGSGNHEKLMATARYGSQFNQNTYGRFYLHRHEQGAYDTLKDKTDAHDDWLITQGGFRFDGDLGLNDTWTLQGDLYQGDRNLLVSDLWIAEPPYRTEQIGTFDVDGHNILARWEHKTSDTNVGTAQIYYDYTNRKDAYLEQTNRTLDIDLQQRFQYAERHDIVWGLGYRLNSDDFSRSFQIDFTPDSDTQQTFSAFAQDEIALFANKVWLTLGSKFEHNDYSGFEVQPNVRVLWKPQDNHRLWASISRAVRTPSRIEDSSRITTLVIPPSPTEYPFNPEPIRVSIFGKSEFKSERLIAYEVGYRYLPKESISFDLTLFFNDYDNLQAYSQPSLLDPTIYFDNTISGEVYGLEFTTQWSPTDWLKTELSYSYIDIKMKDTQALTQADQEAMIEGSSPQNQISLKASIALQDNLHLNLWGRYVDKLEKSSIVADFPVDDYTTLDANIRWQPVDDLELSLVGQNLFDNKHLEYISEQFTEPTEIGRSLYAKLTWHF